MGNECVNQREDMVKAPDTKEKNEDPEFKRITQPNDKYTALVEHQFAVMRSSKALKDASWTL